MARGEPIITIRMKFLRFGEIWLRETACYYGCEPYIDNPNQDKEHKGKMIFQIERKLPKKEIAKMMKMVKFVETDEIVLFRIS